METLFLKSDTLAEIHGAPPIRQRPRVRVNVPVHAWPVLADGGPDLAHRLIGHTVDIGLDGVGMVFPRSFSNSVMHVVIGIPTKESALPQVQGAEIVHTHAATATGSCEVGCRFQGFAHELLKAENLTPRFHGSQFRFKLPQSPEIYDRWVEAGVLEAVAWDKVLVCPRCRALPTFSRGCPSCGSVRLTHDRLMHHFACAHIGLIAEFEKDGNLTCPKCRTRSMVVGTDYEYAQGPFRCGDCQWSDTELEQVGQCMACRLRFPVSHAHEEELRGYRAHRMDPLAFLPESRGTATVGHRYPADRRSALFGL